MSWEIIFLHMQQVRTTLERVNILEHKGPIKHIFEYKLLNFTDVDCLKYMFINTSTHLLPIYTSHFFSKNDLRQLSI